jgi:hypothetical protein
MPTGRYHSTRPPVPDCPQPDTKARMPAQWHAPAKWVDTRVTCDTCRWFAPDPLNPTAGMGRCLHTARHGYFYATAKHHCHDHTPHQ